RLAPESCKPGDNVYNFVRLTAFFAATLAVFGGTKIAPDLPQSNPNATIDVIVQFKTPPSKDELKQLGPYGQIKKTYSVIKGINIVLPVSAIKQLQSDPNVSYISPNRKAKGAV